MMRGVKELARDAYPAAPVESAARDVLRPQVRTSLVEIGINTTIGSKDIGYKLRCSRPIPFDIEYTRTLEYGAARHLLKRDGFGALIAVTEDRIMPASLEQLED
jgi:hypothetical protein